VFTRTAAAIEEIMVSFFRMIRIVDTMLLEELGHDIIFTF
jgi:hypothetical protein